MLIQSQENTTIEWSQPISKEQAQRRSITREGLVLPKLLWHTFCFECFFIFANGECIWLRKEIAHQFLMICDSFILKVNMALRLNESNELSRNNPSLMHELIEAVLAIGAWFTEDDGAAFYARTISDSLLGYTLAIAFHVYLLNMSCKPAKRLAIWQDCSCSMSCNISIVPANQTQENWHILLQRRLHEMLIHCIAAPQEVVNMLNAEDNVERKKANS